MNWLFILCVTSLLFVERLRTEVTTVSCVFGISKYANDSKQPIVTKDKGFVRMALKCNATYDPEPRVKSQKDCHQHCKEMCGYTHGTCMSAPYRDRSKCVCENLDQYKGPFEKKIKEYRAKKNAKKN